MKLPEHLALSFLLAQCGVQQEYGPAGTGLMLAAGLLPDLDGLTLLAGWRVYRTYHRVLGHGLPMTFGGPVVLAAVGAGLFGPAAFLPLWLWMQLGLLAHLVSDVLFYNWPVQLLWPVSRRAWAWGLVGWNDLVPTLSLYGGSLVSLCWPAAGLAAAAVSLAVMGLYLGWRAVQPRPRHGIGAWLAGGWANQAWWGWRWLTGDFLA